MPPPSRAAGGRQLEARAGLPLTPTRLPDRVSKPPNLAGIRGVVLARPPPVPRTATPALLLAALAAGCNGALPSPCGGGICATERIVTNTFQSSMNRQLDILFVIDDTPAMVPHAERLATGIANMARVLQEKTANTSLHVGVVPASPCGATPAPFMRWETCGQ